MIRPISEYCSVVFHSLITRSDSLELEGLQAQALKSIFAWKFSYNELLKKSGLERLEVRRDSAVIRFAEKLSNNPRFASWLPLQAYRHNLPRPGSEKYKVYPSTTERHLKSPLNNIRRQLNKLNA